MFFSPLLKANQVIHRLPVCMYQSYHMSGPSSFTLDRCRVDNFRANKSRATGYGLFESATDRPPSAHGSIFERVQFHDQS
jgi:hypothetical protein